MMDMDHEAMGGQATAARAAEADAPVAPAREREGRTGRRRLLKAALGVAAATVGAGAMLETDRGTAKAWVAAGAWAADGGDASGIPNRAVEADATRGATGVNAVTDSGWAVAGWAGNGGTGVLGANNGLGYGVVGTNLNNQGTGVRGTGSIGVAGEGAQAGVQGRSDSSGGYGVYGLSPNGRGVVGISTSPTGAGVLGQNFGGEAGHFNGNVAVTGVLSKGGGAFKIDHPTDPANKYLLHSFVESPDMLNIYNGIATLDARGSAVVALPEWFGALNKDYRYQLTAIGGPGADLHIAAEVADNRFAIAGGAPGLRVSWQVTGVRRDRWANAHRIPVEERKAAAERGRYLHPALYGQPEEEGIARALPVIDGTEGVPARDDEMRRVASARASRDPR